MSIKTKIFFILLISLAVFLRLFRLSSSPASLYWEEAALGYDAYSILKTGADFHGQKLPLVSFVSFGDYKPSAYFYFTTLSESFFGLTPVAVRLPSALAGLSLIALSYFISLEIFSSHPDKKKISWLAALITAFSPWAIQFSRAGFEANLATAFSAAAILFLLKSTRKIGFIFMAVIFFSLSLYTYHSARIFIPLILISSVYFFKASIKLHWRHWLLAALLGFILVFPLLANLTRPEIKHRFQETTAFSDISLIKDINQKRLQHHNSLWARLVYHRYWAYGQILLENTFDHFDPNYLFLSGDHNPRHSTGQSGIFYALDAVFLYLGLLLIFKSKKTLRLFLPLWWLAAIIPAAVTKTTPHALRTLLALPAPQIIIAFGLVSFLNYFKSFRRPLILSLVIVYAVFGFAYFYNYFGAYTKNSASAWQYGYQSLMTYIAANKNNYQHIFITRRLGRPSIYYFFYNKIDPHLVQNQEKTALKDQAERLEFQNINFFLPASLEGLKNTLLVATPMAGYKGDIIKQIKDLNGQTVFNVYELK